MADFLLAVAEFDAARGWADQGHAGALEGRRRCGANTPIPTPAGLPEPSVPAK
jgi:hypothetical protein